MRPLVLALAALLVVLVAAYLLFQSLTGEPEATAVGKSAAIKEAPSAPAKNSADEPKKTPAKKEAAKVKSPPLPPPVRSCDDLRVLVDHEHPLPAGYIPQDLTYLNRYGLPELSEAAKLRQEAAQQLSRLMAAARADNEELVVASAYRSYEDQQSSYTKWANFYGDPNAAGMSALPGHSQHQLGTAVDFTNSEIGYAVHQDFGKTAASEWLKKNAADYGFVLAYPNGGETDMGYNSETGYNWEPWHYRYIGKKNASRMKKSGLGLQAFLTKEDVRPLCGRS